MSNIDPNVQAIAEALANALNSTNSANRNKANQQRVQQRKDVTYNANTQYGHGPSGVFNTPGVNRDVWMIAPRPMGIASRLPFVRTQFVKEMYEYIMPVTAGTGSEPANDCAAGPNPGDATVGFMYLPFGKVIRTTPVIDVNRQGELINRAEPLDLNVINYDGDPSPFIPDPARNPNFMNSELGLKYFTLGIEIERVVEADVFTGNQSSNNPATTGRQFFNGLDLQLNTGRVDALYGNPLTQLDSLVINWNGGFYNGTVTLNGQAVDMVTTLSATMNYLIARARLTNSLPATWGIAMRYDLFYLLTSMWPCSYLTNGCVVTGSNLISVLGSEQVAMRDEMRNPENPFLWINGVRYPVFITDQISETTSSGKRVSNVYVIPLTARGRSTAFFEYFDMENEMLREYTALIPGQIWSSNNGLFLWNVERTRYCLDLTAKVRPRLIITRPDLGARITNVGYNSPIPTNNSGTSGLYIINPGVSTGSYGGGLYVS